MLVITMSEATAMAAMRADADALRGARQVRNADADDSCAQEGSSAGHLIDKVASAAEGGGGASAFGVLKARSKPLSNEERKALFNALKPNNYKGISKLKNAEHWAKALVELCMDAGGMDMSVSVWVQCARAML